MKKLKMELEKFCGMVIDDDLWEKKGEDFVCDLFMRMISHNDYIVSKGVKSTTQIIDFAQEVFVFMNTNCPEVSPKGNEQLDIIDDLPF